MKKAMYLTACIPLIVTASVLPFLPDTVPMHYDLAGKVDRFGSKYENLLFPFLILGLACFWHIVLSFFERKTRNAPSEKEQAEARVNAKLLGIVSVSMSVLFGAMQCFILYSAYVGAAADTDHAAVDIGKISCLLTGILCIVLGNFLTKAKKNGVMGVRTSYSMYNDNTWRKSNRFGGAALIVLGLAVIVTTALADTAACVLLLLFYILLASTATVIYSKKVYDAETR